MSSATDTLTPLPTGAGTHARAGRGPRDPMVRQAAYAVLCDARDTGSHGVATFRLAEAFAHETALACLANGATEGYRTYQAAQVWLALTGARLTRTLEEVAP